MRLIFLGPPGAGKGTQSLLLLQRQGVMALASGDILREAIRRADLIGRDADRFMKAGQLVPDKVITGLMLDRLGKMAKNQPFVLDGFPRTEDQARALDAWLLEHRHDPIDRVIDFEMDEDKILERLEGRRICRTCGTSYHMKNLVPKQPGICDHCGELLQVRPDDQPETIRRRFVVYHRQTEPLLKFYGDQEKVRKVPGDLEIEAQYQALLELLKRECLV